MLSFFVIVIEYAGRVTLIAKLYNLVIQVIANRLSLKFKPFVVRESIVTATFCLGFGPAKIQWHCRTSDTGAARNYFVSAIALTHLCPFILCSCISRLPSLSVDPPILLRSCPHWLTVSQPPISPSRPPEYGSNYLHMVTVTSFVTYVQL